MIALYISYNDHRHVAMNQFVDAILYFFEADEYDDDVRGVCGKSMDFLPNGRFENEYNDVVACEYEGFDRHHRFLCFCY